MTFSFVKIIRPSINRDEAKVALMARYPLPGIQTNAILERHLYRLTGMELVKIEVEHLNLMTLEELRAIPESDRPKATTTSSS